MRLSLRSLVCNLRELMDFCTKLQQRVLDLENTKTAQAQEITSLKKRVKKLEKKGGSRTHKLKRLYRGRGQKIHDMIFMLMKTHPGEWFMMKICLDVNDHEGYEGIKNREVITKEPRVPALCIASSLEQRKEQAPTPIVSSQQPTQVKDKGKGKMVEEEPVKKMSKKELLKLDEELAFKLQAEECEEERLLAQEQEELFMMQKKNATFVYNLREKRRKTLAAKKEQRREKKEQTTNKSSAKEIGVKESSKKADEAETAQERSSKESSEEALEQKKL
ncbi:hypothetical protein Tco_1363507 [Tanacetum coccineum]